MSWVMKEEVDCVSPRDNSQHITEYANLVLIVGHAQSGANFSYDEKTDCCVMVVSQPSVCFKKFSPSRTSTWRRPKG